MIKSIDSQQPLATLVYEAILNGICEGTLKPGERLTQEGLADRLSVSRLPVGQAIQRLNAEGFVCSAGRRGVKVAPLTAELVQDLYEFRSGVDMVAAGAAAQWASDKQLARGREILAAGQSALAAHDIPMLIGADIDFHQLVYEMSGNAVITDVMDSRWRHTRRVMSAIIDDTSNQTRIWQEHEAIFTAIAKGIREEAEKLARAHVENAADWLQEELEANQTLSKLA